MKVLAPLLLLLVYLTSCVPKSQFDALVVERNYYRNQAVSADSLANARTRAENDSLARVAHAQEQRMREIETLKATNRSLSEQVNDLRARYEDLLAQNREMVSGSGDELRSLQSELAERQAELNRRESTLRQAELDLRAREQRLSSIDEMRSTQPGPQTYDRNGQEVQGTTPPDPESGVDAGILFEELRQLMLAVADSGYRIDRPAADEIHLSLPGGMLFADSSSLTIEGQRLLRRLGGTLRNYPQARYVIIGYAESADGSPLPAYGDSAARAARVAVQLAQYGIDPGRVVAGGQGFYGALDGGDTAGQQRVDIEIAIPD